MSINATNKIDVKSSALTGQRVIKLTQNGEDIFLPVGLSALTPNGSSGTSNVKFGYWTEDGKFQELDLSGDSPVDSGSPVSVDAVTFKTGKDTPDYGGGTGGSDGDEGSEDAFYMATSLSGVLSEIEVTAGSVQSWMYDYPISLVGKYTIVDPGASGTDRKWVCNATTAGENQESAKVYLRTFDIWSGYDDNDNEIYEKRWGFTAYDNSDAESSLIYSDAYTGESPFSITGYETGMDTNGFVKPVFAPAVDEPPYGASAWNGKQMLWGEHPIYITYGGKLENSNGYWVRIDEGQPLSVESTWVNLNGKARIEISSKTDKWVYWWMYVQDDKGAEIPAYRAGGSSNQFMSDALIHPFRPEAALRHNSTDYMPVPTMIMANEGWYPSDSETVVLPIKKNAPAIGSIYNSDATVRIAAMYPAK